MLEIYNSGDQPVVNPVVSVEVFRAPTLADPEVKTLEKKRRRLFARAHDLYRGDGQESAAGTPPVNRARGPGSPSRARMR